MCEDRQCFGDFGRLRVELMRSVWIMNEPADLPHDSVSSLRHEISEAAGFQSTRRADFTFNDPSHESADILLT